MELMPHQGDLSERTAKKSALAVMLFCLVFVAWVGEWPLEIDTVMYNGLWRSPFVVFAPLFTPLPGISLLPWQLLLMILALFCIAATGNARRHAPEMDRAIFLSFGCIAVTFVYGMFRGGSPYYAYYQVWRYLAALLLAFAFMSAVRSYRDLAFLGKLVVFATLIRAGLCIYVYWTQVHRIMWPLPQYVTNHDDSILFVVGILIVSTWAVLKGGKSTYLFAFLLLGTLIYAVVLNTRRIAWVELVFAIILIYLAIEPGPAKSRINKWAIRASPLAVAYFLAGMGSDSGIFAPVHALTTAGSNYDPSSLTRQEEARNLLHTVVSSNNPLFGTGWGIPYDKVESYWSNYSSSWILVQYTPHNALLGLAAFAGLFGILGIWGVMPVGAYLAARGYRASSDPVPRGAALVALGALATYSVHCYGDIGLQSFQGVVLFGVALGTAAKVAAWSEAVPATQTATDQAADGRPVTAPRPKFGKARPTRTRIKPSTQRLPR